MVSILKRLLNLSTLVVCNSDIGRGTFDSKRLQQTDVFGVLLLEEFSHYALWELEQFTFAVVLTRHHAALLKVVHLDYLLLHL